MHSHEQLRDMCCHLGNMIEDINRLCAVPDVIISQAMSPFAKLLWPLFCLVITKTKVSHVLNLLSITVDFAQQQEEESGRE